MQTFNIQLTVKDLGLLGNAISNTQADLQGLVENINQQIAQQQPQQPTTEEAAA